ncbi:MAG: segregation/condensation protein A [Synergistaceae bacterium]|jgi:segregation and condensation protein A|nr:segregation/condensation protein A [Synergistaceae bacterium]
MPEEPVFQVTLGEFSGPLDRLCHLVESRSIDASSVKLTEVLSQYVSYLLNSKKATLAELADFFSLASKLLIRKVRSLLPQEQEADGERDDMLCQDEDEVSEGEIDEAALQAMLERFRPYRIAANRLMEMKAGRERSYVRISDEGGPPWFDIGDLYSLSTLWWSMIEEHSRSRAQGAENRFMMEIPDAVPEEVLVERRMDEILSLVGESRLTLTEALRHFTPGNLIVTLLALLELSRLGRLRVSQDEAWGNVAIERRELPIEV